MLLLYMYEPLWNLPKDSTHHIYRRILRKASKCGNSAPDAVQCDVLRIYTLFRLINITTTHIKIVQKEIKIVFLLLIIMSYSGVYTRK